MFVIRNVDQSSESLSWQFSDPVIGRQKIAVILVSQTEVVWMLRLCSKRVAKLEQRL